VSWSLLRWLCDADRECPPLLRPFLQTLIATRFAVIGNAPGRHADVIRLAARVDGNKASKRYEGLSRKFISNIFRKSFASLG
jgi:hypothetical protein